MAEIRHLGSWRQNAKRPFSQKQEKELWCLLTTYRKSYIGFSKNPLLDPRNPRWLRSAILKIDMTSFFSAEGGRIWIKFCRSQSYVSHCSVLPPGEFNGMLSQSHVSYCRVLPLDEFTVIIREPHATLQSAVTWPNQCYDCATMQGIIIPSAILKIVFRQISFILFLSASLYVSKRGAYWDRLCRDVVGRSVGWLSRACTVAKRCILGL